MFLRMGLDVHCTDNEGNTPMHIAAYEYSYIVSTLGEREGVLREEHRLSVFFFFLVSGMDWQWSSLTQTTWRRSIDLSRASTTKKKSEERERHRETSDALEEWG